MNDIELPEPLRAVCVFVSEVGSTHYKPAENYWNEAGIRAAIEADRNRRAPVAGVELPEPTRSVIYYVSEVGSTHGTPAQNYFTEQSVRTYGQQCEAAGHARGQQDARISAPALTFDEFRRANVARCIKWHPEGIASWSPSDWLTAVTGELGELASLLKMRNRERDGLPGNKFSPTDKMVADEIADVLTYLDLLAEALGVNLGLAAVEKFNEVSARVGFDDRIELAALKQSAAQPAQAAVLEGWQLVPKVPGWNASMSGIKAYLPCTDGELESIGERELDSYMKTVNRIYIAMLAAAPKHGEG